MANIREAIQKKRQAAEWILEKSNPANRGNHVTELREALKILRKIEADKNEAKEASENENAS